jgi:hypothetical protein
MRGVGFEPTQIALRELESRALTARPSSLKMECKMWDLNPRALLHHDLNQELVLVMGAKPPINLNVAP